MRSVDGISSLHIFEIIPQRPPFVFVDRLLEYDQETTGVKTSFTIPDEGAFIMDGWFSPLGLIENMAQSCAARIGFYDWLHELPVKPGVIGSIKDFEVFSVPQCGEVIITSIIPKAEALGVLMAQAECVDSDGNVIARCTLKVAV